MDVLSKHCLSKAVVWIVLSPESWGRVVKDASEMSSSPPTPVYVQNVTMVVCGILFDGIFVVVIV